MRDLTFEESVGFPINRIEDIDTVRRLLAEQEPPKQEEPVKLRSVVIDLTAPAQEETPAKKEELPAPPPARREKVSPFVLHRKSRAAERHNFRITDDHLGEGGAKTKFKNNVAAIRTLNEIEFDDRLATPEEQEILSRYVGWGGLPQAFDENNDQWADEFAELYGLLSPEEYEAAKATTLNAPLHVSHRYQGHLSGGGKHGLPHRQRAGKNPLDFDTMACIICKWSQLVSTQQSI